jgi:molybdenum cofactor sulfurtransferase
MFFRRALARLSVPSNKECHDGQDSERRKYDKRICLLRKSEYSMLKGTERMYQGLCQELLTTLDTVYLDHGGTTLASKSLVQDFARRMQKKLLSNPHSDTESPSSSASIIAETRNQVLDFFQADPAHFDVVFTANATAAIKLVADALSGTEDGFDYYYHYKWHTSLIGVGELAKEVRYLASNEAVDSWLSNEDETSRPACSKPSLFAYPAQSNMDGERLPTHWPKKVRASSHARIYTLLDAAAFVSTGQLSLRDHNCAADFVVLSFYKIFGFPDLGALIVRKASADVLKHKRYFGGGTTEMIACRPKSRPWVVRKEDSLHDRLEDGTKPIRSILALACAIDSHKRLFGGMEQVSKHTAWLSRALHERLGKLHHANGQPVCHFYKARPAQ